MRNIYDAMQLLVGRGLDRMNLDELKMLAGATDYAESEARRLSAVCSGVACLVMNDSMQSPSAGNFQDGESVFGLLCSLSNGLDTIAALIHLGEEAECRAQEMQKAPES